MALLVAFAFLAGIVTVLSPCILPLLPVVLSGSVGGGRSRPYGIIAGFVLSFAVFTLTLSALVMALGISADVLRYIAAAMVLIFGLVMVIPFLKEKFSVLAGAIGSKAGNSSGFKPVRRGFCSGFVLGLSLGLVWTPCVGPIMASVISLSLSSSVDSGSVAITLAYSLGTSVPLLLIMKGGRGLLGRLSFLSKNADKVQKAFGVLMVASSLALFTGADRSFQSFILSAFPNYGSGLTTLEENAAVRSALEKRASSTSVPSSSADGADFLTLGSGIWLNSPPLTLAGLKGKVVLVDFWTYSCVNCLRTLPYLRAWHEAYEEEGLVIVGVHSPEFAFERSAANLRRVAEELGVSWPVVQDNDFGIWNAFRNRYWPSHYLYGRDGVLLGSHSGEGGYEETEALIRAALGMADGPAGSPSVAAAVTSPLLSVAVERTPETYLGYARGERFSSPETPATDAIASYSLPADGLDANRWALAGKWIVERENSTGESGSILSLRFIAAKVHLVVKPLSEGAEALVTVDGGPVSGGDVRDGVVAFDGDRLYTLFDGTEAKDAVLKIELRGSAAVYAFTFG